MQERKTCGELAGAFIARQTVRAWARGSTATPSNKAVTFVPNPTRTFHPFKKLPIELRLMIWELASDEPRVVEIDHYYEKISKRNKHYKGAHSEAIFTSPTLCPPILHVSREVRNYGLKKYSLLKFGKLEPTATYVDWENDFVHFKPYVSGVAKHGTVTIFMHQAKDRKPNIYAQSELNTKLKKLVLDESDFWDFKPLHLFPAVNEVVMVGSWDNQVETVKNEHYHGKVELCSYPYHKEGSMEFKRQAKRLFSLPTPKIVKMQYLYGKRGTEKALTKEQKEKLMEKMPVLPKEPEKPTEKRTFFKWDLERLWNEAGLRGLSVKGTSKKEAKEILQAHELLRYDRDEKAYKKAVEEYKKVEKEYYAEKKVPGFYRV